MESSSKGASRARAKERRRRAREAFESLYDISPADRAFSSRLLELMHYDDVLPSIIGEWIGSGNTDVRKRAEMVHRLLGVQVDRRSEEVSQIRRIYLEELRDRIQRVGARGPIVLEVPVNQNGPVLSSVDKLLLSKLSSLAARYELDDALTVIRKITWPQRIELAMDVLVHFEIDSGTEVSILVRLLPKATTIPKDLRSSFQKLAHEDFVHDLDLNSLAAWEPTGTIEERLSRITERLYNLYIHGYAETTFFRDLLELHRASGEKKRLNGVAQLIESTGDIAPLELYATINSAGELNPISEVGLFDLLSKKCAIDREDLLRVKGGMIRRTGMQLVQIELGMDVVARVNVEIKAPAPDLTEFLMDDLKSKPLTDLDVHYASEQELMNSLEDESVLSLSTPSEVAEKADILANSCRILFQAGFYHRIEFKRRFVAYCLAKSYILVLQPENENQISSRKYYLAFLSSVQRLPEQYRIYDLSAKQVFAHIIPTYSQDLTALPGNATELISLDATWFRNHWSLPNDNPQNRHILLPNMIARALVDVSSVSLSLGLSFVNLLGDDFAYGGTRDTLAFLVLVAWLEAGDEPGLAIQLISALLDNTQWLTKFRSKLSDLLNLVKRFKMSIDYYDIASKYVETSERITILKSEADHEIDTPNHHHALVLSRMLARLQQWAEELFMKDSMSDPNLASSDKRDPSRLWAYMTKEGYTRARKLLVEYEKGLAEALELKAGGGDDSGDTYHDSFTFEEGERQVRMYQRLIKDLKEKLALATIITTDSSQLLASVEIGATVEIRFEDSGEVARYTILGGFETNPSQGIISNRSPLGSAILGAKVGDTVQFKVGLHISNVKVLGISK